MVMYLLMAVVLLSIKQDTASTYSKASFNKHLECRWMSLSTDYSNYHHERVPRVVKEIWGRFTVFGAVFYSRVNKQRQFPRQS